MYIFFNLISLSFYIMNTFHTGFIISHIYNFSLYTDVLQMQMRKLGWRG